MEIYLLGSTVMKTKTKIKNKDSVINYTLNNSPY